MVKKYKSNIHGKKNTHTHILPRVHNQNIVHRGILFYVKFTKTPFLYTYIIFCGMSLKRNRFLSSNKRIPIITRVARPIKV